MSRVVLLLLACAASSGQETGEGPGTRSLGPAWQGSWFHYGGLGLVAALVAALLVIRRLERGPRPPSLRVLRAETDRAIAQSDDAAFFAACRAAVQARLSGRWGCAPGSITLAEMRERRVGATLQAFFDVADAVAYSGRQVFQEEMRRWQELVLAEIVRMDNER